MNKLVYLYKDELFPAYLKTGNACQFIAPVARHFCRGHGLDIGAGRWPLEGAIPVDRQNGDDVLALPFGSLDFVFSSHCLEHLDDPIAALRHWKSLLRPGGVLFLYLPHPSMQYWLPQNCAKHRHAWWPEDMAQIVADLGFENVIRSERDMAWSFAVVGFNP